MWINFDGGTLEQGVIDNGPGWVTFDEDAVGEWPPYDDAAEGDSDELLALLQEQWSAFDVCLTREQPELADYELVIVSTTVGGNPNDPGPSPLPDCDDDEVNNVIVRTMPLEANLPTPTKAASISGALGGSFGLEDVDAPEDLMHYAAGAALNDASFSDECQPLYFERRCAAHPSCVSDQQNSHSILLEVLGPA